MLLVLLTLPLVSAEPRGRIGPFYEGVATQGSVDETSAWFPEGYGCSEQLTRVVATLTLLGGAPEDVLQLEGGFGNAPALARLGQPAVVVGPNPWGCGEFRVTGLSVADEARYVVSATVLPLS